MVESSTTPVSPISSPGPREVVESFLRLTVDRPDLKKARLHLSRRSQATDISAVSPMSPGTMYTLGAEMADELGKWIPVNVKKMLPSSAGLKEMTVPVVVVQEEGEWKIDLPSTMERLMGNAAGMIGDAMSAVGSAMSSAMDSVLTAAFGTDSGLTTPSRPEPAQAPAAVRMPVKVKKSAPKVAAKKKPAKKVAKKPAKKVSKKVAKKATKKIAKAQKGKAAKAPKKKAAKKARR